MTFDEFIKQSNTEEQCIPNVSGESLSTFETENIEMGSEIITDGLAGYLGTSTNSMLKWG